MLSNPEMCNLVVHQDNRKATSRKGKPTPCAWRKAAVVESEIPVQHPVAFLRDTTGV